MVVVNSKKKRLSTDLDIIYKIALERFFKIDFCYLSTPELSTERRIACFLLVTKIDFVQISDLLCLDMISIQNNCKLINSLPYSDKLDSRFIDIVKDLIFENYL